MKFPSSKLLLPGFIFGLLFLYIGAVFAYQQVYAGRILPGVNVAGIDISNTTQEQALLTIRDAVGPALAQSQLTVDFPDPKPDTGVPLAQLIGFKNEIASQAYTVGRKPGTRLWYAPFLLRAFPYTLQREAALIIREDQLRAMLEKSGTSLEAADAAFAYQPNPSTDALAVSVTPERDGIQVDVDTTVKRMKEAISFGEPRVQAAVLEQTPARVRSTDLEPLTSEANLWLSASLTLTRDSETLSLSPSMIGDLLTATSTQEGYVLTLDDARLSNFFNGHPFTATSAPTNGWIKLNASSTITDLQLPTRGQVVDLLTTKGNMEAALKKTSNRSAKLAVKTSYGVFEGEEAERLGVRELIGKGDSNFSGSPTNRRKNIALGAERLHKALVGPGQTFSTMKTLGPITGEAGWLPELVIKGNQTTPEFGGGLCQIGTTAFRAALNAGLPITERRNHSYRVRYYEPAGTDATLYDPSPDFKFKNDSAHHILITKDLRKDDVSFLIWGTKDGRIASTTTPLVTNVVQPPPKKTIETTDLKPGEVKCTESAHAGATASFNYSVLYADGRQATSTFRSVYRPWQAVCLVGVEKLSVPDGIVNGPDETGLNSPG